MNNPKPTFSRWYRKYRIAPDSFAGYEVLCWRIWWPFWTQVGFSNTHPSPEAAREWLRQYLTNRVTYL